MPPQDISDRRNLIEAIKTPLGFFSLVVLVIESLLGGLAIASAPGADRMSLVKLIVGILVLIIILVAVISWFRPEALWGKRYSPLDDAFATGLAEEFYTALDGYLSNLEEEAREEAYELLRETIASSPHIHSRATRKFSETLVETIISKAKIRGKWSRIGGGVIR
jgi:hypothetical protein